MTFIYELYNSEKVYREYIYNHELNNHMVATVATAMHRNNIDSPIVLIEHLNGNLTDDVLKADLRGFWHKDIILIEAPNEQVCVINRLKSIGFVDINNLVHYMHSTPLIYADTKFQKRVLKAINEEAELDLSNYVVKL